MKIKILFISLLLLSTIAFAGSKAKEVKGTVLGYNGEALAGAKIEVKGTGIVVYSDFDGNFSIDALKRGSYELKISLISYQNLDVIYTMTEEKGKLYRLTAR